MRSKIIRLVAGTFASLCLILASSAAQPATVCASTHPDCSSEKTDLKCNDDYTVCCTVTKDKSEICGCGAGPGGGGTT